MEFFIQFQWDQTFSQSLSLVHCVILIESTKLGTLLCSHLNGLLQSYLFHGGDACPVKFGLPLEKAATFK